MNTNEEKQFKVTAKTDFMLQREISGNKISVQVRKGEPFTCLIGIDGSSPYVRVMKDSVCIAEFDYQKAASEVFEFEDGTAAAAHQIEMNKLCSRRFFGSKIPEFKNQEPQHKLSLWRMFKNSFL